MAVASTGASPALLDSNSEGVTLTATEPFILNAVAIDSAMVIGSPASVGKMMCTSPSSILLRTSTGWVIIHFCSSNVVEIFAVTKWSILYV